MSKTSETVLQLNLQRADVPTLNGRVYPRDVLEKAVKSFQEKLQQEPALGSLTFLPLVEVDSPKSLEDASHLVTNVEMKDNRVVATIKVLDTAKGRQLIAMLEKGQVEFSLYGNGTMTSQGTVHVVGSDFLIESVDAFQRVTGPADKNLLQVALVRK